jgi:AcrR family transcriptional regulator
VSRKTLYNYFENRENLQKQLLSRYFDDIETEINRILADKSEFIARSDELMALMLKAVKDLELLTNQRTANLEYLEGFIRRSYLRLEGALRKLFTEGQETGIVRTDIHPMRVVEIFLTLLKGDLFFNDDDANREERIGAYTQMILHGIVLPGTYGEHPRVELQRG